MSPINLCEFTSGFTIPDKCTEREYPFSIIYFIITGYVYGAVVDHNQLRIRRQSLIGGGNGTVHFSCSILRSCTPRDHIWTQSTASRKQNLSFQSNFFKSRKKNTSKMFLNPFDFINYTALCKYIYAHHAQCQQQQRSRLIFQR